MYTEITDPEEAAEVKVTVRWLDREIPVWERAQMWVEVERL